MNFFKLKYYRKKAGLSQSKLAELTGIPQTTISGWEKDIGEPSVTRAILLAQALQTTVEELFPLSQRNGSDTNIT